MPAIEQRLERLELNSGDTKGVVTVYEYINPDFSEVSLNGYCLLNGEKIQRSTTESAAVCEGRAIDRALQVAGGVPTHLEAINCEQP